MADGQTEKKNAAANTAPAFASVGGNQKRKGKNAFLYPGRQGNDDATLAKSNETGAQWSQVRTHTRPSGQMALAAAGVFGLT